MRNLVTLLGVVLLLSSTVAHARSQENDPIFRDVPKGHWAYRVLATMPPGDGIYPYPKQPMTRYGIAVATARLVDKIPPTAEEQERLPVTLERRKALRELVAEFEPELKRLGCIMAEVNARLANPIPFPNVPTNHWATSSVEKLRKAGIVVGDPSGAF